MLLIKCSIYHINLMHSHILTYYNIIGLTFIIIIIIKNKNNTNSVNSKKSYYNYCYCTFLYIP